MKTQRKTEVVNVRLDLHLKAELDKAVLIQGLDKSNIARLALRQYLHQVNRPVVPTMGFNG